MKNKTSTKQKSSNGIKRIVIKSLPTEKEQATTRIEFVSDYMGSDEREDKTDEDLLHAGFNAGAKWMKRMLVGNVL